MIYAIYYVESKTYEIVSTWEETLNKTKGNNARYKKFKTEEEAKKWLENGANYSDNSQILETLDKEAIYFDSGTGRTKVVEVKLSDIHGQSLLPFIMPINLINEYDNYYLSKDRTNNFGELSALYIALKYALKYDIKKICGDSKLVIDFWSLGSYNEDKLDKDTIDLINKVIKLRKDFENLGGKVMLISGDINPADLGFHK